MNQQESYTALLFLSDVMLYHLDNIKGTPNYRQKLKNLLNQIEPELEKLSNKLHNSIVEQEKNQEKKQDEQGHIPFTEMCFSVSKSYEELAKVFKNTPSWQMPYLVQLIERAKERDVFKQMHLEVEKAIK